MAPMYDEDDDMWTGAGLSKQIAAERLAEKQAAERANTSPSVMDRVSGGIKGAMGGASTGAAVAGPLGAAIGGVLGGAAGAVTADKKEKAPTASEMEGGINTAKGLYDQYKKGKETEEVLDSMQDLGTAWS